LSDIWIELERTPVVGAALHLRARADRPQSRGPSAPPLYARSCDECGYVEISDDPDLVHDFRRCPRCRN